MAEQIPEQAAPLEEQPVLERKKDTDNGSPGSLEEKNVSQGECDAGHQQAAPPKGPVVSGATNLLVFAERKACTDT